MLAGDDGEGTGVCGGERGDGAGETGGAVGAAPFDCAAAFDPEERAVAGEVELHGVFATGDDGGFDEAVGVEGWGWEDGGEGEREGREEAGVHGGGWWG